MNTKMYLCLLGIFFCLAASAPATTAWEIRLHPQAVLTPGPICLADVADITVENPEQKSRLDNLVIAQFPQTVTTASVGVFDISRALAQANINPAAVCIYGASCCRLTWNDAAPMVIESPLDIPLDVAPRESENPSPHRTVADQLTQAVVRLSGMDENKLKVEWNCSQPKLLELEADPQRFVITPCSTATLGEVRFEVTDQQIPQENRQFAGSLESPQSFRVYGRVEYLCQSVVAKRCLKPGEVIGLADVELRPRRVTSYRDIGVSELEAVLGQEVARTIAAQNVVLPGMIRKLKIIKRRQLVDIYSRVGAVEVKVVGMALTDGAYGDTISVSFGEEKIIVQAKVIGPGEVTVTQNDRNDAVEMVSSADQGRFRKYIEREK